MYGESSSPGTPPSHERKILAGILARNKHEPSMAESVLRAADMVGLKISEAENRAAHAEADLLRAQEELSIDPDTGLWTEQKFNREVDGWVHREGASLDTQIAIVFIDMNNLKAVNDSFGHAAGDQAIKDLAVKIQDIADIGLRADDFRAVSRSNKQGDEFILALPAREMDDLRDSDQGDDIRKALRGKIKALIVAGHEDNHYASGFVITTRGEILKNGLDMYKQLADEQMYKNKQRMKSDTQLREDEWQGFMGTHQI